MYYEISDDNIRCSTGVAGTGDGCGLVVHTGQLGSMKKTTAAGPFLDITLCHETTADRRISAIKPVIITLHETITTI